MFNVSGSNGPSRTTPDPSMFGFSNSSMILSSMKQNSNNRSVMRPQHVLENYISHDQEDRFQDPEPQSHQESQNFNIRNGGFSSSSSGGTRSTPFSYSGGVLSVNSTPAQYNKPGSENRKKKGISFKETGQNVVQIPSRFDTLLSQTRLENDFQMPSSYSSTKKAARGILKNRNSKSIAENINYDKLREIEAEDYNKILQTNEINKKPTLPENITLKQPAVKTILRPESLPKSQSQEDLEHTENQPTTTGSSYQPKKITIGLADDEDEEENRLKNIFSYSVGKMPLSGFGSEEKNSVGDEVLGGVGGGGGGSRKLPTFDIFDMKGPSTSAKESISKRPSQEQIDNHNSENNTQNKSTMDAVSKEDTNYYPNEFPSGILTKPTHNIIAKGNYLQSQHLKGYSKIGDVWKDTAEKMSHYENNNNKKVIKVVAGTNVNRPSSIFSFNSGNLLSEFKTISKDASFFADKPEDEGESRKSMERKILPSSYVVPKQANTGITYSWQKPSENLKDVIIDKNEIIKKALIPGYYEGTFSYFKQLINQKNASEKKANEEKGKGFSRLLPENLDEEEESDNMPRPPMMKLGDKKQEAQKKPNLGPIITSFVTNDATYNMNFYYLLNKSVIHHNIETLSWSFYDFEASIKGECLSFCDLRDNRMMICGGIDPTYGEVLNSCYIFDGASKKLTQSANMQLARYFHLLLFNNGNLYAIGGISKGETVMRACERFNLVKQEWTQLEPLKLRRKTLKGVSSHMDEALYVFGKSSTLKKDSNIFFVEKYDIASNNWSVLTLRHSLRFNEDSKVILALRNTEASRRPVSHLIIFTKDMVNEEEQVDSVFINLIDYQVSTNIEFRINPSKYFITHKDDIYVFPKNAYDECDRLSLVSFKTEHLAFKKV